MIRAGWMVLLAALSACTGDPSLTASEAPRAAQPKPGEAPPPVSWSRTTLGPLSAEQIRARPIYLLVPSGDPPPGGWPYLVVTDGDLAFDETFAVDVALKALVDDGAVTPTVVIAVPAVERTREMTPTQRSMQSLRRGERVEETNGGVDSFADFVADVVLPAVRREVSIAESGSVLGYSYGGLAAIHVGLRHPQRFPRVVAMSPSLWFARREVLFAVMEATELPRRVWLDVGTREGDPGESLPYMVADARQLRRDLTRRGVDVGYYEAIGRAHGSTEAAARMRWALQYVLSEAPECDPVELELHAFERSSRPRRPVATTVLARCEGDAPRTIDPRDVRFETTGGGRVSQDGLLQGSQIGTIGLRAHVRGLRASTSLRIAR